MRRLLLSVFIIQYSAALRAMEDLFVLFQFHKELGRYVHIATLAYFILSLNHRNPLQASIRIRYSL